MATQSAWFDKKAVAATGIGAVTYEGKDIMRLNVRRRHAPPLGALPRPLPIVTYLTLPAWPAPARAAAAAAARSARS